VDRPPVRSVAGEEIELRGYRALGDGDEVTDAA